MIVKTHSTVRHIGGHPSGYLRQPVHIIQDVRQQFPYQSACLPYRHLLHPSISLHGVARVAAKDRDETSACMPYRTCIIVAIGKP